MGKQVKYSLNLCMDCQEEFLAKASKQKFYCPVCGDNIAVKNIRYVWIDRVLKKKIPWTEEEDKLLIYGVSKGFTFKEISDGLDGRTEDAARRRYYVLTRKGIARPRKQGHRYKFVEENCLQHAGNDVLLNQGKETIKHIAQRAKGE